jgi:23S rRNA pseudouridine1911/1915/1917 synthase
MGSPAELCSVGGKGASPFLGHRRPFLGIPSSPLIFTAVASDPRDRLDKLVVARLARDGRQETRAEVQRWIDRGRVRVDGAPLRASAKVAPGARIEVHPDAPPATSAAPDASVTFEVIYEDAHLVVVDKPAGLVVHPARGHEDKTLVNGLLARGGFERAEADARDPAGHLRPGIVHRLDKGTSGLLVVAKDARTREALKAQFAVHSIEREYLAVAAGAVTDATFDTLHARHPTDRLRFTSRVDAGRHAITHVSALASLGGATLVACRLETGRTHQIRVHLAERAGAPILGDPLYGRPPKDPALRAAGEALGRQALHARVLGFVHPTTGKRVRWESPLPADIEACIASLRAPGSRGARGTRQ